MDVEGAEWAVLDAMVRQKDPLPFTQLLVRRCFSLWVCKTKKILNPALTCSLQTR